MIKRQQVKEQTSKWAGDLISIRRYLHAHSELSFKEENTAQYISSLLDEWGISYTKGIAGHGISGLIKGKNHHKKVVALRADIDALPIYEKNNISYKSKNKGIMHACGHDVHTTCLLGTIKFLNLNKDNFEGSVKFIFQPAEEKLPGGAIQMIKAGILKNPVPDVMIGQHVFPDLEVGKVGFRAGMYMASADEINLYIRGKGGHAAMPEKIDDTVLGMAEIISSLQKIVSRKAPPSVPTVLSFGKVVANGAHNVIPSEVIVQGTFRTFDEIWRKKAHYLISKMAKDVADSQGLECDVIIDKGYPFLKNDSLVTQVVRNAAEEYLGKDNVVELPIRMTAEDFASFAQLIPSAFYRLGTANKDKGIVNGLHTPNFNVDEKSIEIGTGLMIWNTLKLLLI